MRLLFILCCVLTLGVGYGQKNYTLSGYVKDSLTGETLISANIFVADDPAKGTISNTYGFYSLSLPPGEYDLVVSYLGYGEQQIPVKLDSNIRLNVTLTEGVALQEVVVTGEASDQNVRGTEMGTVDLSIDRIKTLPAVFGEVDVLKAIQLLPGVQSAGEGNAGFYVRGGGPDQNLVLLDEAIVYNSGHLLGFFSVFNADALKNTTLIKGGMPANYGGRLSSVVDVQMKEGNDQQFGITGGIGLISSRLTVEGPIVRDRSSFIVSGRRTYIADLAQPLIRGTDFAGTNYFFYDLNAKINYRFSDQDRIYLSAYFGRDVLKFRQPGRDFFFDLPYGNGTATLRWNHLFSDKLFMNASVIYNNYDFSFSGGQDDFSAKVFSGVRDYNGKLDFEWFPNPNHNVKYGLNYTYHKLTPNTATAVTVDATFDNGLTPKFAHETAFYFLDEINFGPALSVNAGFRFSIFTQLGPYESLEEGISYTKGEPVQTYTGLEPRLSARYRLNRNTSFKAGFAMTYQYLHLVSNSTSTLPTDIWVPSSQVIEPQIALQYAVGWFQNFANDQFEASVEVYYKDLQNQIDYPENFVNDISVDLENVFVFGRGRAYGIEFFLKKRKGKFTGWIGYTLARTEREFPDINDGAVFPTVYDRRHDLSLVLSYKVSPKWELGATFVYGSGNAFTPIRSLYFIEQNFAINYGDRNSARLPAYHRLDFAATWTPNPDPEKRFHSIWTFSVYNLYNRQNPFFIFYELDTDVSAGTSSASAFQVSLFPIIPSITWNFKWNSRRR